MKILLINPPFSEQERYGKLSAVGTLFPPLGLAYVAAVAELAGHTVQVVESEALGCSYEYIYGQVEQFQPDLIGMPTFLNTIQRCYTVADTVRKRFPRIQVLLGGVQVTLNPEDSIGRESVDFVIRGESENVFRDFLLAIEGKGSLDQVAGLVWKNHGKVIYNLEQQLIENLDDLPMPARHLFPMDKYHASSQLRGKRALHMMTSRGCPYRCTYCTSHLTFGKTFRYHSPQRVLQEMRELRDQYGVDSIQFYDETFTLNKRRVAELCDEICRQNLKIPWACFTRVNLVDPDLLRKMKLAGCYQIFYGVEAATQRLLDVIKKDITIPQVRNAFRWTHEAGIESLASFMIGLPTETEAEAYQTIDLAIEIDADYAQWQKTTPFPGTELYQIAQNHGKILTADWTKFTVWNEVVYVTNGRTKEDILKVEKAAFRRFYLRPGYIIRHLRTFFRLPFKNLLNLCRAVFTVSFKASHDK